MTRRDPGTPGSDDTPRDEDVFDTPRVEVPPPPPGQPDTAAEVDPDVAELLGLRPPGSNSMPTEDEIDTGGRITDTRIYQGELESRVADSDQPDETGAENLESLMMDEYRVGETDDPNEAAEEGLTWIPPTDPPTVADERGDAAVAAGFSTSADDEPFDADHHGTALSPHDEVELRVLEALRADAATVGLADGLVVDVEGGRVRVSGSVEDLEEEDAVVALIEGVPGVTQVDSRIQVRALAEGQDPRAEMQQSGGGTR